MIWASQWFTHPSEKKKKKKKLLPAFTYLTLNPAKSLWNTIPFSSIIPFDSLFHSSLRLTWYIYNDHTFFPPSTSKLIRSSMTLTFATISPFSLNLPSHSTPLWLPISACVSDDPWMRCKSPIETRVTEKKKTPYNLGYLSLPLSLMERDRPAVMAHLLSKLKKVAMKTGEREWESAWQTGSEGCNVTGVGVACVSGTSLAF